MLQVLSLHCSIYKSIFPLIEIERHRLEPTEILFSFPPLANANPKAISPTGTRMAYIGQVLA